MAGFFIDPLYLIISIPALLLGLWAQSRVQGTFNQYSKVRTGSGVTGAQAARTILDHNGLQRVGLQQIGGTLSDHYDPGAKVLRLSKAVYELPSIASVGVAAHEAGHALQDKENYSPLRLRSVMVPAVQFGSWLGPILFLIGFIMAGTIGTSLAWLGVILFGLTALFAVVTLPVEFDASARAKKQLAAMGILTPQEVQAVDKVLDAAALTYVAAAVQAISAVLYYVLLLNRRSE
jgi:uncharacterized protein